MTTNTILGKIENPNALVTRLAASQKNLTLGKNVQNSLFIKSIGSVDKLHAEKERM